MWLQRRLRASEGPPQLALHVFTMFWQDQKQSRPAKLDHW
jgi:hypothetical protein